MRMRRGGVVAVAVVLTAAGCAEPGNGPTPAGPVDGPADGPPPAAAPGELRAACGAVEFATVPADWSAFPPVTDLDSLVDLAAIAEERELFDDYDWFVADETDLSLTLFGTRPTDRPADDEPPLYANAELRREGDRWRPESWGGCRIELAAPGWGNARFVRDPDVEPDPASATVDVLAWEAACASGQAPDGRRVEPVILTADDRSVLLVVLVEPVHGGADCQSNPSFPLRIDLAEPLDGRTIVDASTEPGYERPWPPTQTSLDSEGLTE